MIADADGSIRPLLPEVTREELVRLIDPEAFGLPSIVNNLGEDYLTDRDEARAKADAILAMLREKGVVDAEKKEKQG